MFKFILTLLFLAGSLSQGWCIDQWVPSVPASGDNPVNFPTAEVSNNNTLSRILTNYRQGASVNYNTSSSLTIGQGEVSCNSATPYVFRKNISSINATTVNLDTGSSFSASTIYYVYANCDASATTFTVTISLSSSTPSGVTNYKQIGTFTTDSGSNILSGTVNSTAYAPVMADSNGNQQIQGIYDYGTSGSVFTFRTGNLKEAYGTITIAGSSSQSITNLPFTSSSTYVVEVTQTNGPINESPSALNSSGNTTVITNNHNDSRTFYWDAKGT